jgi:hypothetical protein
VPQDAAISDDREAVDAWRKREGIDPSKQIRITKLSHMRYQHPDLAEITTFLRGELRYGAVGRSMRGKTWAAIAMGWE